MQRKKYERKLSGREAKFVTNLLSGMGKRDSAVAAGYSAQSAHSIASVLLNRDRVLEAIREGAEKKLRAGAAIGATILSELALKAKSEDVKLRAAQALLDRGGLPLVKHSETRHIVEDRRSDAELLEYVRSLSRELGIPINVKTIEGAAVDVTPAADVEPAPEPVEPADALPIDPFGD